MINSLRFGSLRLIIRSSPTLDSSNNPTLKSALHELEIYSDTSLLNGIRLYKMSVFRRVNSSIIFDLGTRLKEISLSLKVL